MPARKPDPDETPKQRTPKGVEIPVPTREAFMRDLEKVAKPAKPEPKKKSKRDAA